MESIGYDVFGVCKLKEVKLLEVLVNIEGFVFYRNKLIKVEFGSKVKRLELSLFVMNEFLELNLFEIVEYIGVLVFYKNFLEIVSFLKFVIKIDMYVFRKNNIYKVEVVNFVDLYKFVFEIFIVVERF